MLQFPQSALKWFAFSVTVWYSEINSKYTKYGNVPGRTAGVCRPFRISGAGRRQTRTRGTPALIPDPTGMPFPEKMK